MLIQDRQFTGLAVSPMRSGVLREFVPRQDRVPRDQRVDLPEIQESFRVSFSEQALAAAIEAERDVPQKTRPLEFGSAAYLRLYADNSGV